jgi:hypothetical protein
MGTGTTLVALEATEAEPAALVAVSRTRIVRPASPVPTTYAVSVAAATSTQAPPVASQRCHW